MAHLESIEVSFRAHITYLLAHSYGPLGYTKSAFFNNENYHKIFLERLTKDIDNKGELFIKHHKAKYGGQFPIWVATEVMSFGTLSKLFNNMKAEDKKRISNIYNVHYNLLTNWLDVLSYVRNSCAHYSRIYNKVLVRKLRLERNSPN
jgi:abortive infection bacteriophage resistance protein